MVVRIQFLFDYRFSYIDELTGFFMRWADIPKYIRILSHARKDRYSIPIRFSNSPNRGHQTFKLGFWDTGSPSWPISPFLSLATQRFTDGAIGLPCCVTFAACIGCSLLGSQINAQEDAAKSTFVLIENVNIFDGTNNRLTPGSVLIENNLIKEVGPNIQAPTDTVEIDGGGRTLMPGLMDAHVHLALVRRPGELRNDYDWMYNGAMAAIRLP